MKTCFISSVSRVNNLLHQQHRSWRRRIGLLTAAAFVCSFWYSAATHAAQIGFDFTGVVNSVNASKLPNSSGLNGEAFTGRLIYDLAPSSSQNYNLSDGVTTVYRFESPPTELSLTLDGVTYVAGSDGTGSNDLLVEVTNREAKDSLAYFGDNASQTIEGFPVRLTLSLNNGSPLLLPDTSLPQIAPNLADFAVRMLQLQVFNNGGYSVGLTGELTSITPVPEPAALWLAIAAIGGLGVWRWRARRHASAVCFALALAIPSTAWANLEVALAQIQIG
jgi:hypothetical protein